MLDYVESDRYFEFLNSLINGFLVSLWGLSMGIFNASHYFNGEEPTDRVDYGNLI
jgi:hypothetical protein